VSPRVAFEPIAEEIDCGDQESVLDAAFRQGYILVYGCREGQCSATFTRRSTPIWRGRATDVYICGPPSDRRRRRAARSRYGVDEDRIFFDKFTTSADAEEVAA
jgi:hypothetical protein